MFCTAVLCVLFISKRQLDPLGYFHRIYKLGLSHMQCHATGLNSGHFIIPSFVCPRPYRAAITRYLIRPRALGPKNYPNMSSLRGRRLKTHSSYLTDVSSRARGCTRMRRHEINSLVTTSKPPSQWMPLPQHHDNTT